MPKASGVWRQQWQLCDTCKQLHPIGQLNKQKGKLVCYGCLDNLLVERRSRMIAERLGDGREAENPKADKQAQGDPYSELSF